MAKRGALTKLTPEVSGTILATLEAGNTRACAAYSAGIAPRTLANWMARGRKGERGFAAFYASARQAELRAEAVLGGAESGAVTLQNAVQSQDASECQSLTGLTESVVRCGVRQSETGRVITVQMNSMGVTGFEPVTSTV